MGVIAPCIASYKANGKMVSSPSQPAAPDPTTTAAAQTASNQATALYQTGLNDVNQNTPLGDISYNINPSGNSTAPTYNTAAYDQALAAYNANPGGGTNTQYGTNSSGQEFYNPSGTVGNTAPTLSQFETSSGSGGSGVPSVTSNITLNPQVQAALNSQLGTTAAEGNLAQQYEQQVNNTMQTPYNLNSVGAAPTPDAAYQQSIMNNQNQLEQPYIDRSNEQLQASLANQGITAGSQAYNNAEMDQNNSLNNLQEQNVQNATQQEQSQFAMQQQAYQQQLQNYSQNYTMPLNQLSALQSGSQVTQPSFSSPAQTTVSPTNVAGITQNSYQDLLNASNANQASSNSMMSGLFGLGGSLGAAALLM